MFCEPCETCSICLEIIESNKNQIITECNHKFHTSCLMNNIAHNGFDCPNCRSGMASNLPEDEDDDSQAEEDDDIYSEDSEESGNEDGHQHNETDENAGLEGMRILFRRTEREYDNGEEDYEDADMFSTPMDSVFYENLNIDKLHLDLIMKGYSMVDLLRIFVITDKSDITDEEELDIIKLFKNIRTCTASQSHNDVIPLIDNLQDVSQSDINDFVNVFLEEDVEVM